MVTRRLLYPRPLIGRGFFLCFIALFRMFRTYKKHYERKINMISAKEQLRIITKGARMVVNV